MLHAVCRRKSENVISNWETVYITGYIIHMQVVDIFSLHAVTPSINYYSNNYSCEILFPFPSSSLKVIGLHNMELKYCIVFFETKKCFWLLVKYWYPSFEKNVPWEDRDQCSICGKTYLPKGYAPKHILISCWHNAYHSTYRPIFQTFIWSVNYACRVAG